MSHFKYYVELRAEILEIVTGVENASHSLHYDNTTPNWVMKRKLERLFEKYLARARSLGLLVVTRHSGCQNPSHEDYPISNSYGLNVQYKRSGYIWNGGQFYQGKRICVCPCSSQNKETEHHVIDDIIYEENSSIETCTRLEAILCDIYEAFNCAGDKKPRSAIREYLLRALLRIHDELLPEPLETYIAQRLAENGGNGAGPLGQWGAMGPVLDILVSSPDQSR